MKRKQGIVANIMSTAHVTFFMLASVWLVVLGWYDCSRQILPNWLTCSGALAFLAVNFLFHEPQNGMNFLLGGVVGLLFLLIPFLGNYAGGGDVKMLMAVGCLVGFPAILNVLFLMSIFGFLIAVAVYFKHTSKARLLHYLKCCCCYHYDREAGRRALPRREHLNIPLGPAISLATWLIMALMFYNNAIQG